jgi:hypothetical protein
MLLSAVCAMGINASVAATPADTLYRYIINNEMVEKFDGSQLVGKTVSDYKVVDTKSNVDGNVVRLHMIRTDGVKMKDVKSATSIEGVQVSGKYSKVGEALSSDNEMIISAKTVYIINGKKCDWEALSKIKPAKIASMVVYKPASKEAVKLSGENDVAVIEVVTKK